MGLKFVAEEIHPAATRRALRAIALFEAMKGIAAFAATVGILDLMHHDVRRLAIALIGRLGWDPGAHYPSVLLYYAGLLPHANVPLLVFLALGYIVTRLLEAYGLWNDRVWGEWLGALSGGIYIPFEINHLAHRCSALGATVLAANVCAVGFLTYQLWRRPAMNPPARSRA